MLFGSNKSPKEDLSYPVQDQVINRWRERNATQSIDVELVRDEVTEEITAPLWTDLFSERRYEVTPPPTPPKEEPGPKQLSLPEEPAVKAPAPKPAIPREEEVLSALGAGTMIEGKLSFDTPVKIDGILRGDVTSNSALFVGEHASVNAKIRVGSLIVHGEVTGDVVVEDLVEIKAGGDLQADIKARRLIIEDGGSFNGRCTRIE